MLFTAKEARQKWKYLRDYFQKELKKYPSPRSGDASTTQGESTWQYFPALSFLKDQMLAKPMSSNLKRSSAHVIVEAEDVGEVPEHLDTFDLSNDTSAQGYETTDNNSSLQTYTTNKRNKKVKLNNSDINEKLLMLEEKKLQMIAAQQSTNNEIKSDDYHYFMSLLTVMKKFNDFQKMRIRNKINEVIMAELSILQGYNQSPLTTTCPTPLSSYESGPSAPNTPNYAFAAGSEAEGYCLNL